jgi:hypothetical protein
MVTIAAKCKSAYYAPALSTGVQAWLLEWECLISIDSSSTKRQLHKFSENVSSDASTFAVVWYKDELLAHPKSQYHCPSAPPTPT